MHFKNITLLTALACSLSSCGYINNTRQYDSEQIKEPEKKYMPMKKATPYLEDPAQDVRQS